MQVLQQHSRTKKVQQYSEFARYQIYHKALCGSILNPVRVHFAKLSYP